MAGDSYYTLLLGVNVSLEKIVLETNPDWKGSRDKDTPQYIQSSISRDEYLSQRDHVIKDEHYAYGEREFKEGHAFPNGQIVQNFTENGTFADNGKCDLTRLCFMQDDRWLDCGESQLLGLALLFASTESNYSIVDEQRLLSALGNRAELAEMVNKYGFSFRPEDIKLYQYLSADDGRE
jgi:hypothetical protein